MNRNFANLAAFGLVATLAAVPAFAMDKPPVDPGTPSSSSSSSSGGGTTSSSSGGSGSPTSIPEPGMLGLFALGTIGALAARRVRRRG
ncbi:PEP-CTERM sorting domain-containing protein [Sphingomonas sp.]|uniref:PEP-CTERM sorting domain-containing protein n=1 Tax=Sphingomonas sp. TaxID=28214 RepID=UPI0025EFFEBD|nr:PEP-CTERM sorting domain-containing protein [Sphingomonas sp.]